MSVAGEILHQQGQHICMLYRDREEQLALVIEYLRAGLERGERCLYVCGEFSIPEVRAAFERGGIDVAHQEARGALLIETPQNGYLPNGSFDPDGMIAFLGRAVTDALNAGFTGLRATGDMSWILAEAPGSDRLAEYESRLNQFYRTHKALGLCLYNRSTLPTHVVDHSLATHPHVRLTAPVVVQNPFYEDDYRSMHRKAADPEIVAEKLDILDATAAAQG